MDIEQIKKEMLNKKVWAVVGATDKKDKFGYKIYKKLKSRGYEVYPINPGLDRIDGDKCYKSILDLEIIPDCVDMVVPPKISNKVIEDIVEKGVKYVWFQPGTFNEDTISLAEERELKFVYYDCVLVALDKEEK